MAYRIEKGEAVADAVRRIAVELLDESSAQIGDRSVDRREVVHDARKRFKKLRGLIRLARFAFPKTYAKENAAYRDAAAALATVRDAQSAIESFEALCKRFGDELRPDSFGAIRARLDERLREVAEETVDLDERLGATLESLRTFRERAARWKLRDSGFDAIEEGFVRIYADGREAMETAYDDPSIETFHEWRKCVKYHGFHLRLLEPLWKKGLKAQRKVADGVEDALGDEHDLALLVEYVDSQRSAIGDETQCEAFLALAGRRREVLQRKAHSSGEILYAESPKALVRRMKAYWEAARAENVAHETSDG